MTNQDQPLCILFDNGSLRAASTLGLRRLAAGLSRHLNTPVRPVSLLHSSAVPVAELEGVAAELLEPTLEGYFRQGGEAVVLLPLFFGPSGALVDYVPDRVGNLLRRYPAHSVRLAAPLVDIREPKEITIAAILADRVRNLIRARRLLRPAVLLTDHGSPLPAVTAVRDHLTRQLADQLAEEASTVGAASMERREGEAYAFNEPLLERALKAPPFDRGDVVVALQFLQPGRHAGAGGDVEGICKAAEKTNPRLRTHLTDTIGADDSRLLALLAKRWQDALKGDFAVLSARYPERNA